MKKATTFFLSVMLIAAIAPLISSCKKETENQAPAITIEEPKDNAMVTLPAPVHIEGTITDNEALHEASILATGPTGDTVLAEYPIVHGKKSYDFHTHFTPSATGTYTVQIIAEDHEGNRTTATRRVMAM